LGYSLVFDIIEERKLKEGSLDGEFFETTDSTFDDDILDVDLPCLVYFSIPWSKESRENFEMIEELAYKYVNKIKFFKIEIEKNPRIVSRYNVTPTPTIIIFQKGEDIERFTGEIDSLDLMNSLNDLVKESEKIKKKLKRIVKIPKTKIKIQKKEKIKKIKKVKRKKKNEKKNNHRRKLENEPKAKRGNKAGNRDKK